MYTLYSKKGSCSMAVHILLNELGQDVTLEPHQIDGKTNPELKKVNPRKNVPTLQKGDFVMREGGAILAWLCDEADSPLLPKAGYARANALQWLLFANATLHPAYSRAFFIGKNAQRDQEVLMDKAIQIIQTLWNELDMHLADKEYVCGDDISVADILLTVIANWSSNLPKPVAYGEHCSAYFRRVSARPAFQKALEEEGVVYNAVD